MTDNLQMGVRTRRLARAVLGCAAICAVASARADDYVLAAGETDAFAFVGGTVTNFTSMTVAGSLEITGDGWIKTPTLNLDGGTLTVDGAKASIGTAHYKDQTPTTVTFTNAADGTYGKVIVKNGTAAAQNDYRYNFGAKYFNVATNAPEVTGTDGYLDVLSVDGAGIAIREAKNYSTLTARISVAGTSLLSRGGGYAYGAGIFMRGAFAIDLKEGSALTISTGNQLGAFNSANVPVVVGGTGDLVFSHVSNETQPYYQMFNKGAMLNNVGNLSFSGGSGANGGVFGFGGNNIIGPNVRTIRPTGYYKVALRVAHPYTVTVHDVDFVRSGYDDRLLGDGDATIRIDASSSPCAFRANIPPFYVLKQSSVTSTNENSLAVEKIGSYEATISSTTNIPTLNVLEGVVRITSDCVISNLCGASGATLIADGCRVSITGEAQLKGLALETANGGTFVKTGGGRTAAYDPGTISGGLHVASGSVVFSKYGFAQKYWRWTFTKIYNGPKPLHIGRFWLFGTDGKNAAPGLPGLSYVGPTTALAEGRVRWHYDASTNLALKAGVPDWQGIGQVAQCFRTNFNQYLNNFAYLSSPEIDPGNPASHLGFELRLNSTAKPLTGYNFMPVLNNDYPMSWTVEASDDGEAWTTVETRADVTPRNPTAYYFYDGENANDSASPVWIRGKPREYFHFNGYRNDGLAALAEPLSLQVDAGAMVDLRAFSDGQPINRIAIDLSAGGGTIYGGTVAAGGTLALTNVAASGFNLSDALPLAVDGLGETVNLKAWTVVIDGAPSKYKVMCSNGQLVLVPPGVCIIIR
jgi:hypothetical protein